jgi:hypothetical protein
VRNAYAGKNERKTQEEDMRGATQCINNDQTKALFLIILQIFKAESSVGRDGGNEVITEGR